MKVAFIGTGSMGSLLIEAFLRSGALYPHNLYLSNRSKDKIELLALRYPGIHVSANNADAAQGSDIVFICVKPHHFPEVIAEIRSVLLESQLVISITSPVLISMLENQVPSKIAKIIPSVTHTVHSGASLCIYGERVQPEDRLLLEQLMSSISRPIPMKESETRIASDISSCGPAFISFIVQQWARAAAQMTGISMPEALILSAEMLLGTGRLLTEGGLTPEQLQRRVAVPGGVTAEGLAILEERLQGVFPSLIEATQRKHEADLERLTVLFESAAPEATGTTEQNTEF
ncbi:late competence protein ComER [Paenibacillus bouchesdurhonensis]|uniref:late competence protein ComER n=1 Tax=Paenibacillus bouchesdurhonensis TaxID=1870990 RepID=UPI000DA5EE9E|nr:late competence protein ComER [Paenibacillus bouchesdurhonensis]